MKLRHSIGTESTAIVSIDGARIDHYWSYIISQFLVSIYFKALFILLWHIGRGLGKDGCSKESTLSMMEMMWTLLTGLENLFSSLIDTLWYFIVKFLCRGRQALRGEGALGYYFIKFSRKNALGAGGGGHRCRLLDPPMRLIEFILLFTNCSHQMLYYNYYY